MPTTVTSSIGVSSRNYSTVQSWEDACPSNLVTDDKIWRGECYNDGEFADTTVVTLGGTTCDSTHYYELTAASGQSFVDGSWSNTDYSTSNGVGLRGTSTHAHSFMASSGTVLHFSRLQFYNDSGHNNAYLCFDFHPSVSGTVKNCFIKSRKSASWMITSPAAMVFTNCVIMGTNNAKVAIGPATFKNCTFVKPSDATAGGTILANNYGRPTTDNCAGFGWDAYAGDTSHTGDYNATDDTWAPGSNSHTSLTYADQFETVTTSGFNCRPKTGSTLINNGTRDATNTNDLDIMGNARSITTPTIGAFEYASAAATSLPAWRASRQQHLLVR